MPRQPTQGKAQFGAEVNAELLAAFRAFAKGRGETFAAAIERAMRRDMLYPQPLPEPAPLPDVGPKGKRE